MTGNQEADPEETGKGSKHRGDQKLGEGQIKRFRCDIVYVSAPMMDAVNMHHKLH